MYGTTFGNLLLVGAGGFLGSTLRYAVGGLVHRFVPFSSFPWGTLTINVVGCLAIGLVAGAEESRQALGPEVRLFLMIGLLGGFTTFSTFGLESLNLVRDQRIGSAFLYVAGNVLAGFAAVWLGHSATRML